MLFSCIHLLLQIIDTVIDGFITRNGGCIYLIFSGHRHHNLFIMKIRPSCIYLIFSGHRHPILHKLLILLTLKVVQE